MTMSYFFDINLYYYECLQKKRMNKVKQVSAANVTTLLPDVGIDHKHIDNKSVCHRKKVKINIILPISSQKKSSKKLQVIIATQSTQVCTTKAIIWLLVGLVDKYN